MWLELVILNPIIQGTKLVKQWLEVQRRLRQDLQVLKEEPGKVPKKELQRLLNEEDLEKKVMESTSSKF